MTTPGDARSKTPDKPNLYERIAEIAGSLTVDKNGHMKEGGTYDYIKHADLIAALKPILKEQSIVIVPLRSEIVEATEFKRANGGLGRHVRIKVVYRVVDSTTGEGFEIEGLGESVDTGDKGTQKAITSAEKYLYMRLFKVTEDAHDTDGIAAPEGVKGDGEAPRPPAGSAPIPRGATNEDQLGQLKVLAGSMKTPWADPVIKARLDAFGFDKVRADLIAAGATGEIAMAPPPPPPPPPPALPPTPAEAAA